MIVPGKRLLLYTAALTPMAALAGVMPLVARTLAVLALGLIAAGVFDAWRGLKRTALFSVRPPSLLRLTKDRPGRLTLILDRADVSLKRIRMALNLSPPLTGEKNELTIDLPEEGSAAAVEWTIVSGRRGLLAIPDCRLEISSPWGLWAARRTFELNLEVRVYPNLLSERKRLAALFLRRGGIGVQAQRQIGKGRDFEQLRNYLPGDCYEDIHWKATAKRGEPVTKVYQIERTQEVYVIIDASRLSGRLTTGPESGPDQVSLLERFVTSALVLGMAAQRQGDLFGLITFSDKVRTYLRAKNGRAHYDACREALFTLEPSRVAPDFTELFTFLSSRLRRRALLLFLTNLDDPVLAEGFVRDVSLIARRHLVLVNMIAPPGAAPVFSEPEVTEVEDIYQSLGGHIRWRGLDRTGRSLKKKNVDFALLTSEALSVELISRYMAVKRRQSL